MLKTTQSTKNLSLLIADDTKVGSIGGSGDCKDKTVEKLPLTSKNLNKTTG